MVIQWYPGHMEKARREMQEKIKIVDMVIECRDARMPIASKNPLLDQLIADKARLILLTKSDLADDNKTKRWLTYLNCEKQKAIAVNLNKGQGINKKIIQICLLLNQQKREKQRLKGISPRAIRAMVCGIPNVGKSTFINRLLGQNRLVTENRPGVTRSLTWLHISDELNLLDTPGVLWPKFEDPKKASILAALGTINDDILDQKMIAMDMIRIIQEHYPHVLPCFYQIDETLNPNQFLQKLAWQRGYLQIGNKADTKQAARSFLHDLRKGKIARLSLEDVNEML